MLTKPVASVTDHEERLKSRWMAAMFVALVPLGLLIASIPALLDHNPPWEDPQVRGVLALSAFLSFCYALSRRGYYRASALSALVVATIAILSISLIDNDPGNVVSDASYLVATVLFSSIMLSQRHTAVILVLSVIALLAQPLISPQVSMEGILKGPMSLLLTTYGLIVFGIYLRDAVEKHH
ncbi:MAG: hypothetical protein IT323_00540, partial [Anaerolineae bacterium]|nr:hypothetical protein [Anaerolineae bacterium]